MSYGKAVRHLIRVRSLRVGPWVSVCCAMARRVWNFPSTSFRHFAGAGGEQRPAAGKGRADANRVARHGGRGKQPEPGRFTCCARRCGMGRMEARYIETVPKRGYRFVRWRFGNSTQADMATKWLGRNVRNKPEADLRSFFFRFSQAMYLAFFQKSHGWLLHDLPVQ
jgi:hypothetical protein